MDNLSHKQKNSLIFYKFLNGLILILTFILMIFNFILSGALFLFSSLLLYKQIYVWLKFNETLDLTLFNCLMKKSVYCNNLISTFPFNSIPNNFINWLANPTDWLGLHTVIKSLTEMPMWLVGYTFALIIFLIFLIITMQLINLGEYLFKHSVEINKITEEKNNKEMDVYHFDDSDKKNN